MPIVLFFLLLYNYKRSRARERAAGALKRAKGARAKARAKGALKRARGALKRAKGANACVLAGTTPALRAEHFCSDSEGEKDAKM